MYNRSGLSSLWVRLASSFILITSQRAATISLHSIVPSPVLLAIHFFAVAFYSIWVLFAHPRINPCTASSKETPVAVLPRIDEYPELIVFSFRVVRHPRSYPPRVIVGSCPRNSFGPRVSSLDPCCGVRSGGGNAQVNYP